MGVSKGCWDSNNLGLYGKRARYIGSWNWVYSKRELERGSELDLLRRRITNGCRNWVSSKREPIRVARIEDSVAMKMAVLSLWSTYPDDI